MNEIDGAVDGIEHPGVVADIAAGFLAQHRVSRKRGVQTLANEGLDSVIRGADPILRAFGFGREVDFA